MTDLFLFSYVLIFFKFYFFQLVTWRMKKWQGCHRYVMSYKPCGLPCLCKTHFVQNARKRTKSWAFPPPPQPRSHVLWHMSCCVCLPEPCSLSFTVPRRVFIVGRAGHSGLDVWGYTDVCSLFLLFFFLSSFAWTTNSDSVQKVLSTHWAIRSLLRANGVCAWLILCV